MRDGVRGWVVSRAGVLTGCLIWLGLGILIGCVVFCYPL